MAATPLVPVSFGTFSLFQKGIAFDKTGAVKDLTGAIVNLSTWTAAEVDLYSSQPVGASASTPLQTISTGITLNADGTIQLELDPTVYTSIAPNGSVNASVYAKPTAPDSLQCLATGKIQLVLN